MACRGEQFDFHMASPTAQHLDLWHHGAQWLRGRAKFLRGTQGRKGLLGDGEEAALGRSCHFLLVLAQCWLHRHPCPLPSKAS